VEIGFVHPIAILAVAVLLVFVLIVRLKLNAFLALVAAAILIGLLSPEIPAADVMRETGERFGDVVGRIGIAIAMAAIIGTCLTESGAADRIVRRFVSWFGEKRASLSLVASGYVLSVPVFFDTVFYLLVPLARAMSVRSGGRHYVLLVLAISAGGSATHVFVPPTPGPLIMAATLGVDVGLVILVGVCVALPASLCGWLYARWIDRRLGIPIRPVPGDSLEQLEAVAGRPESELPGLLRSLLPILLPVLLIGSLTVAKAANAEGPVAAALSLPGNPSFALALSAAASLWILARQRRLSLGALSRSVEKSIMSAGVIILITGAGGAFGGMLVRAGVSDTLGTLADGAGLSAVVLGFLLAALFKVAQGSGTVTMITVSSILAPLLVASPPSYHPVYVLMSVGAGSLVGQWMNDSGFWIFRTMTGLTEVETLETKSVMMAVMGFAAMIVTVLASRLVPLV
jgi:GntP family gluconate:H+ symporter